MNIHFLRLNIVQPRQHTCMSRRGPIYLYIEREREDRDKCVCEWVGGGLHNHNST